MKRWISLLFILSIILLSFNSGIAQMTSFSGIFWAPPPLPFLPIYTRLPFGHPGLYGTMPFVSWPLASPYLRPFPLQPILAPMSIPGPIRRAAATITIIFNPALSIVNVSVLPITAIALAPTAALVPTLVAPAPVIAPTALPLPTLLALPTASPPFLPTTKKATATPILPGITALLPLLI